MYLFVAQAALTYISMVAFTIVSTRITASVRKLYLRRVLEQDITYHEISSSSGAVSMALSSHCNAIQTGLADKFGLSIKCMSTVGAAFVVAFTRQWKLALVTATIVPATVIVVAIAALFESKLEEAVSRTNTEAASLAEEILGSIKTVRALRASERLLDKYRNFTNEASALGWKRAPVTGTMVATYMFMLYAAYALAFWYGIHLFDDGEASSSGTIVTTLFSITMGTTAFSQLAAYLGSFLKISTAGAELFKVIDSPPAVSLSIPLKRTPDKSSPETGTDDAKHFAQDIEFQNVTFSYPLRPNVVVVDDLSLRLPAGTLTALVGPSGSGKSTAVALLERWYDVKSGCLKVGGQDIRNISVRKLRSSVGLVQQEPFLFSASILQNVLYGLAENELDSLPESNKRELAIQACRTANAHDFITALPQGYDTFAGNAAGLLSGGQKQRLAIARAIVGDPPILILDEATSALDPASEHVVQAALDKASQGRTSLVIAHRLSTIRKADNIVVLKAGKIIEQGDHDELCQVNGVYKSLLAAQMLLHREPDISCQRGVGEPEMEKDIGLTAVEQGLNGADSFEAAGKGSRPPIQAHYGTPRTIHSIISEQRRHWLAYFLLFISCVVGGESCPSNWGSHS